MEKIEITEKENQRYSIVISSGILGKISELVDLSKYSKIAILTDENVTKAGWLEWLKKGIGSDVFVIEIQSGESNKSLKTVELIWNKMEEFGLDRKSLLINLGGGVVGDIGGFCASTYMRGMQFLQIPTTLLSQVDASVGGKTGFNLNGIKNCIGTFSHPVAVIIDSYTLSTLPNREFISGFGEVIKCGLIYDKQFCNFLKTLNVNQNDDLYTKEIEEIISFACKIKSKLVAEDFKENGIRKILNYGHTLGHAIESLSFQKGEKLLLHGEAVAIGMVGEAYISKKLGKITEEEFLEVEGLIKHFGLPVKYKTNRHNEIYDLLFKDKKTVGEKINWVLMKGIGKVDFDIEVEKGVIEEGVKYITN